MFDKILSFFGLVRSSSVRDLSKEPYTDDELTSMYIDAAIKNSEGFDKSRFDNMVDTLRKNEDFAAFLDWTIHEDIKRSFNVQDSERPIVRGAVSRTRYLRALCMEEPKTLSSMRTKISRYG